MAWHGMAWHAMPCHAMLCYAMLRCCFRGDPIKGGYPVHHDTRQDNESRDLIQSLYNIFVQNGDKWIDLCCQAEFFQVYTVSEKCTAFEESAGKVQTFNLSEITWLLQELKSA